MVGVRVGPLLIRQYNVALQYTRKKSVRVGHFYPGTPFAAQKVSDSDTLPAECAPLPAQFSSISAVGCLLQG